MTTPLAQLSQLTIPFVTVSGFKAHPTYLDLANLRSGDSLLADQDDELNQILLIASGDAERFCMQPLQAHVQTTNKQLYATRRGQLFLPADHTPARALLSYAYQYVLGNLTSTAAPTYWVEDGRQFVVELAGTNLTWAGSLSTQFNSPAPNQSLYVTWTYVAGWANAQLVGASPVGATQLTVTNPTGIFAGDTLRIWEPGKEESVTVASTYTPVNVFPFSSTVVQLANPTVNAHSSGAGIVGFPPDIYHATVYYAIAALRRPGTDTDRWPSGKQATTGMEDDASNWEAKAERRLLNYLRVR